MNSKRKPECSDDRPAFPESGQARPRGLGLKSDWPHIIHATAIYTVEDLRCIFGLKTSSVRREVRLGRLRIARRCGRYYCLGKWVLQWIGDGELIPRHGLRESHADRSKQDGQSM
jgi:hypothetical protein